jgi:putative ABC transport system permease protein
MAMGDLKFAARQLAKTPGFTAAAVLTLTLGIGANTAMFSVVDTLLLRSLPYDEPGRLVHVWEAPTPGEGNSVSVGVYLDWVRHNSAFEALAAVSNSALNLSDGAEPERISGLHMSPSGLRILRASPVLGRVFAPDEDQPGKDAVVVITHELWQRRFGGMADVVGRVIRLNGESRTVIGVLPPAFLPWEGREYVVPFVFEPGQTEDRGSHWIRVLGRLKPGTTVARAEQDLLAASQPFRSLYPKWKQHWGARVVPLHEQLAADVKPMLLVLLGAVALVLLIACANVANLLLARASAREKEIAIRLAIGASRARVIRQLLTESLLLALVGAAGGLALAFAATGAIREAGALDLARAHAIAVDARVFAFTLVVSLATSLVFGLTPALQCSRPDLNDKLMEGGRGSSGGRNRTRRFLIVSEVALALVLLAGAGLLVRSFVQLLSVDPGFEPRRALAMQLSLPEHKYPNAERRAAVTERLLARIQALPGVEAAGATMTLPLSGPPDMLLTIPGRRGPHDGSYSSDFDFASPGYFRAAGIPVSRGRLFDDRDAAVGARVAVVNETFVRTYFPGGQPLGKVFGQGPDQWEIVGVVGDVRMRELSERIRPLVYWPPGFAHFHPNRQLVVRTQGPPRAFVEPIRKAILAEDPEQPIANVRSLEELVASSVARRRMVLVVLALFAASAMLLAGIGLYGVIAYSVSQRTREIGIRIAVGAGRPEVQRLFIVEGMRLSGLGVLLGLAGALALTRLLESQLYGVPATDALTFASVSCLLLLVALVASFLPARRVASVEPMSALR